MVRISAILLRLIATHYSTVQAINHLFNSEAHQI
jgi:hypothetical protein